MPRCTVQDAPDEERQRAAHLAATGPTSVTLPFGVTLLAKAWRDEWVWGVAARMEGLTGLKCGPAGHRVTPVVGDAR
jgi:allophanate hydrolase